MMSFKLSLRNIKKSMSNYTIYFITLIFGVALFYTFNSIGSQTTMLNLSKSKVELVHSMVQMMSVVSVIVSIILGYLIVYANNFLIRRRKKEFGLYQTLGMSKRSISKLLFVETLMIGTLSLAVGLAVGVFLSQGMSVMIIHMFEADLSQFQFSFSMDSLIKTIIYFSVIYLLVMVFNVVTINRYKLIHLLNASKKNEKLKVKNNLLSFVIFLISIALIGYGYYLLRVRHVLMEDVNESVIMLISGAVGTYLFFSSLAGFLLKVVQSRKRLYYKNLNMFVLRQVNSRINTMKLSLTIIALMLLLTIGIMSSALSLVSAFNSGIEDNNKTDFSLVKANASEGSITEELDKTVPEYASYIKQKQEYITYVTSENDMVTMEYFVGEEGTEGIKEFFGNMVTITDQSIVLMKESDYNALMKFCGMDEIDLGKDQYAMIANFEQIVPFYNDALEAQRSITLSGTRLTPYSTECIGTPLQNSNMSSEMGTFVVPDEVIESNPDGFVIDTVVLCGNYIAGDSEQIEEDFLNTISSYYKEHKDQTKPYNYGFTKIEMQISKIGTTTIFTFLGLYLGIIFSITSAAILAISQLSESSDNKERYAILRKMGVDDKMINRSLLLQIGIYFMMPLAVAIVHSIVGIREVSRLISLFGNMNLEKNIGLTALFIILVYGGYFIATYLGSKKIIKEKEKYV